MHEIICHHCGRAHRLSDEKFDKFVGKTAQCACGQTFVIEVEHQQQPMVIAQPAEVASASEDEMTDAIMSAPPDQAPAAAAPYAEWPPANDTVPGFDAAVAATRPAPQRLSYRPRRPQAPGTIRDFLEFRRMITVSVVSWIFVLGSIGLILSFFYAIYQAGT